MKILVTGCAGFIGSHLVEKLLYLGHHVEGVDNFEHFYPVNFKRQNIKYALEMDYFQINKVDLRDKDQFKSLPIDIDLVIHLAGKAGVRQSIFNSSDYISSNIVATENLLSWMKENNIGNLIFASSSSVYGNNKKIPFSETDNTSTPISPYAATKKSCELLTHVYHSLYEFNVINLRFFTVYGPRQRPDLAIRKFFNLIINGQPVTLFGDGSSGRDYTYVDDTVKGIVGAINYIAERDSVNETINLGNSKPVKLNDLVKAIYSVLNRKENINYKEMQPGDVDITYADISKAQKLLAYNPKTTIKTGLTKFSEWYFKNS